MSVDLGDREEDSIIYFMWSTNAADGSSITRATDGTISIYKNNDLTQSIAGITDTEDFDSLIGIHMCAIDTSVDAFYATAEDYTVVLSGATIDGKSVNAVLAVFSIENRFMRGTDGANITAPPTTEENADAVWDELKSGHAIDGSFGDLVDEPLSRGDVAIGVWDEPQFGHQAGGSFGEIATEIADIPTTSEFEARSDVAGTAAGLHTTTDGLVTTVDGVVDTILVDTAEIGVAGVGLTDLGGMSTNMKSDVNTEVSDVMTVDTMSEPPQGPPPTTPTFEQMFAYMYFRMMNKNEETATEHAVFDVAGTTKVIKAAVSDSAGTLTKSAFVSGA